MTKQEAFNEINILQDEYVNELIGLINSPDYSVVKTINFTSPTGTGKTKMMAKLINRYPEYYFIVTTLSKGQLHIQIRESLKKDCDSDNFTVYGSADYRINSKLDAEDIISQIPKNARCIWLRDEGHIRTNRYDEILLDKCFKVINFSATNTYSDIQCNFTQTMMLRTVNQTCGTPEDAINKLLQVKHAHKDVKNYNPCAIFRCISGDKDLYNTVIELCNKNNLKYIDITEDPFVMAELCVDDNEYDVIINKFKLIEGIDIRRAHVLYMDNQPANNSTTIQAIGRCRRNALLYRDDIDILDPKRKRLLAETRMCYVYYNVKSMKIDTDEDGELYYAFCDHISCEQLKSNSVISVIDGQLSNGLYILELKGKTGQYKIIKDKDTGFNVISPVTDFYKKKTENACEYLYCRGKKIKAENVKKLPLISQISVPTGDGRIKQEKCEPFYIASPTFTESYINLNKLNVDITPLYAKFENKLKEFYNEKDGISLIESKCLDVLQKSYTPKKHNLQNAQKEVSEYLDKYRRKVGYVQFCRLIEGLPAYKNKYSRIMLSDVCSPELIQFLQAYLTRQSDRSISHSYLIDNIIDACKYHKEVYNNDISEMLVFYLIEHASLSVDTALYIKSFRIKTKYPKSLYECVDEYIDECFADIYKNINNKSILFLDSKTVLPKIKDSLSSVARSIKKNIVDHVSISYSSLFEELDKSDEFVKRNGYANSYKFIAKAKLDNMYASYKKIVNDRESAIVGVDLMHQIKISNDEVIWTESKSVSSKINNYNKFNAFISSRYKEKLEEGKKQCFTGKNTFELSSKCNSMLGYCVEYYSKYLVYGEEYLGDIYDRAKVEFGQNGTKEAILVRACMLKYQSLMARSFGPQSVKLVKTVSANTLVDESYEYFVSLVVELGTKTATYVKETLYPEGPIKDTTDPNLSIEHIAGLADYITPDTILDVKVRNNIDEKCIRQVLAYHYLSTKRSDLNIKRVIVYDAVSGRSVVVNVA